MTDYTDLIVFLAHVESGKSTVVGRLLHDFDESYRDKIDLFKKAHPIFIRPSVCCRGSISSINDTETNVFREYLHRNVPDPVGRNLTVNPAYYHLKNIPNIIRPSLLSSSISNVSATSKNPKTQLSPLNQKNTFTFNLIDSPGHKDFLSAACKSTAGASIAVVVVSAAQGEFEAGLSQRTGQTRFSVMSAYAFGVKRFIFAINKLDTVEYSQQRFQEIKIDLEAFLKRIIPIPTFFKNNITYVPISAKFGENFSVPSGDYDESNNYDDDSSSSSSVANNKMPWNEGHPTLMEALQLASIENYKMNTAPVRSGDFHVPTSWERLPVERRKILEDRMINPLNQQGSPLRAMVFQVISNVQLTLKRRGFYENNNNNNNNSEERKKVRSKYLEKISEIVLVKVISGVLRLGDVLVFEPGTIARKVVSIGFDDDNESISFFDDHENQTNLPFSQGPCGLASLGLMPLSDEEIHDFRQDRRRSDEIEFLQFSTNIDEAQAAVQAHVQKHQHQQNEQQTSLSHGDIIAIFNKKGNRSFKHFPTRQRELRKLQQEKQSSIRDPTSLNSTTQTKEFGRFKKQYDVINKKSGFAFHIKSGSVAGHFLHPDAPRSYFADKDFVNIHLLVMYAPTSDSKLKSGFATTFDCGTQHCPCRIQIVEKLDKSGLTLPETATLANDEKGLREFLKLKPGDCARARLTPLYPHLPLVVDPLFFEGKGSNARTVLGRIVARSGNGRVVGVCAVRSLWMLRKWPFLIRFFGSGKTCEAFQLWNVLVNVCLFLSWTV